ncbi:cation diffusion facilitator family transporter [Campylobacter mucosalis]|uniref:cation diffusion facilitator family transporter n=1 Tax=Campylobacter mucosalis TaxID=202 RepID=UPI00147085F0|nr:cation diffusion facilitator family transporter [Campylobacter mucosalis]
MKLAKTNPFLLKKIAVITAGLTAVILAIFKFIAGFLSGSVSVMSSAIDSMLDCLVSFLNFLALKKSSDAPNAKFNYGYGKLEALSSLFEGVFIIGIGLFILYQSVKKIFIPEANLNTDIGLYVMLVSLVLTGALILFLNKIATLTNNLIIKADALHYKSDFYSNLAIIIALIVIKFTGFVLIDAILGIMISIYIIYSAISLIREGMLILLDAALPSKIINEVVQIILSKPEISSFHYLKSRQSGAYTYLSYHLVFNGNFSLLKAHEISDEIIREIKVRFNDKIWIITPELDPVDDSGGENHGNDERCVISNKG